MLLISCSDMVSEELVRRAAAMAVEAINAKHVMSSYSTMEEDLGLVRVASVVTAKARDAANLFILIRVVVFFKVFLFIINLSRASLK